MTADRQRRTAGRFILNAQRTRDCRRSGPSGGSVDWNQELGEVIDDLGRPRTSCAPGSRALGLLVPFELAAIFVYRGRSRPMNLYDNFELADAKKGIAAYVENTYVLNPFYQAYLRRDSADGVYRIRDLAPDAFFESEYYKILPGAAPPVGGDRIHHRELAQEGLEEIDIADHPGAQGRLSEISVYRPLRNRGFSDDGAGQACPQVVPGHRRAC